MTNNNKTLIAFYSRKGKNYLNGSIVNLAVGNTEVAAKMIQEITGGDLFQIETILPYPDDYNQTTKVALTEKKSNARPELKSRIDNMNEYETIFLGFPNWWNIPPMAVFTFLESYDFSVKTILPFCTHEGSGMGNSEREIQNLCPGGNILPGLAIRGSSIKTAGDLIKSWINKYNSNLL